MQLKDYIKGDRRGKRANRIERKAMSDPFLQEALDGFDAVAGDHVQVIERLEKKYAHSAIESQRSRKLIVYWSVAASVLLLVGFSVFFFLEKPEKTMPVIAMLQPDEIENENEQEIANNSSVSEPAPKEESQKEMMAVAKTVTPAPTSRQTINLELDEWWDVSDAEVIVADQIITDAIVVEEVVAQEIVAEQRVSDRSFASPAKVMARGEQPRQTIRGKVVDETGEPLPGVSIVEKGTMTGTVTDISGNFAIKISTDSPKLIASFVGYESQELKPSGEEQTVILKESNLAMSEVVVVGYGTQKKANMVGAVSAVKERDLTSPTTFGEKEFQKYCQEKAEKNLCDGKKATVKLSFFIDETGKPTKIEYQKYTCEAAKKEIENLLSSSPVWTTTNRKVSMTIKF